MSANRLSLPSPCPPVKILAFPERPLFRHTPGLAVAALAGRLLLAAVFLYTGSVKALDPAAFVIDVRSFQLLPDPWAAWLALGLPWLEIFAALALLLGGWARGALLTIAGMLLAFASAFIQAWARDLDVTCGCFGKTENHTNFVASLAIDSGLLAVTAFVAWAVSRRPRPAEPEMSPQNGKSL